MTCETVPLAGFLVGALEPPEEEAVARHLDGCEACGRELAALASLEEALSPEPGVVADFGRFLLEERRWWLIPALVVLAALASVVLFSEQSAIAPFIYSIF